MFSSLCIRFDCCCLNSDSAQSLARLGCTGFPIALGGLPDIRLRGCRPDQGALSEPCHFRHVPLPRQTCLWSSRPASFLYLLRVVMGFRHPRPNFMLYCGLRPGPCYEAILCLMGFSSLTTVGLHSRIVLYATSFFKFDCCMHSHGPARTRRFAGREQRGCGMAVHANRQLRTRGNLCRNRMCCQALVCVSCGGVWHQ